MGLAKTLTVVFFIFSLISGPPALAKSAAQPPPPRPAPVVVATFDTGTNPFHPCFRRAKNGMRKLRKTVPHYPAHSERLPLTFTDGYEASLTASRPALDSIQPEKLYYVPNTNLSFYGIGENAAQQFVDDYPHGAQASSQIGCEAYGMGSNAHLVILNWYDSVERLDMVEWVTNQSWIDIVHLNIQDVPLPGLKEERIEALIASGKLVVIAAGNGVQGQGANYPMELSRWNGPPGSLIAGANDNGGWQLYSNLNPHVVMDGAGTVAAEPYGYGETSFAGTSSASPRISGSAAQLLGRLRALFGHTGNGLLSIPPGKPRPSSGPLADGELRSSELHEVIRKTADPNPHESKYDGGTNIYHTPQPVDLPFAFYPKMGYGEVSEHTIDHAVDVAAGRAPMPERSEEDRFFERSEDLRKLLWGS